MKKNNMSDFERAVIVALGVVEGQTARLKDGEGNIWASSTKVVDDLSIMTITKNDEKAYKEVYDYETSESKEFFY